MLEIDGQILSLQKINTIKHDDKRVSISKNARAQIERSRRVVEQIISEGLTVYGVNTGFGRLSDVRIEESELRALQLNLVRSHSCGLGPPLSIEETRAMP